MLAHSPPLPLIINYFDKEYHHDLTTEDEEGIILALHHRDRVRRIRLMKPIPKLEKLIISLDGEFPILEFLLIWHQPHHRPVVQNILNLKFPETFHAPHLRRLVLENFTIPFESPSIPNMGNLVRVVTLSLVKIPSSVYFHPNVLLQRLFLMPQLEILQTTFNLNPSRYVERELLRTPIMTRVTLPNLRLISFRGSNAYLEALLPCVTTPLLENLCVRLFNRVVYSIPHLQRFMSTAGSLRLKTATFTFYEDCLMVTAYPHKGARMYSLAMELGGRHLDWQVVSAAQVSHALRTVFSAIEHLSLKYDKHNISSEWNNEADRTWWREFLGSFGNVRALFVDSELVGQISRTLRPGEGESSMELLTELQELSYSDNGASHGAFTSFVDARQKADHPVTIIHS